MEENKYIVYTVWAMIAMYSPMLIGIFLLVAQDNRLRYNCSQISLLVGQ